MEKLSKIRGCMFGLAIGDAVGYPVEFLPVQNIKRKSVLSIGNGRRKMLYSDDTQMSLATSKGMINAFKENADLSLLPYNTVHIYKEYYKWFLTQSDPGQSRAPGYSCMSALGSGLMGTPQLPINDSKGCGGVMRTAPIGLVFDRSTAFDLGVRAAAITHGHKTGYLTAGFLSELISRTLAGENLTNALNSVISKLKSYEGHEETLQAINFALYLADTGKSTPSYDLKCIYQIGEGWVAEEALAISIYCALKHQDNFEEAIASAVCHSGDSDSTGSITGAIVGTILGFDAIPKRWVLGIENGLGLEEISRELYAISKEV